MNRIDLRKVFVQLLFSLAISHVALKFADLVVVNASLWEYHYSYLHLFLCVSIIITSWVGWHNSYSPINSDYIHDVFSLQFIILFIDLCLVGLYFIIVRGAETPKEYNNYIIPPASSYIEVFWSFIIFIIYLLWDILTKIYKSTFCYNEEKKIYERIRKFVGDRSIKRIKKTSVCLIISFIVFIFMKDETNKIIVSIIDLILISLFFTFRGLKQEVEREYELEEKKLSENNIIDIKEQNENEKFPIIVHESSKMYWCKYFVIKILPILFLILFSVLYIYIKI